MSTQSTDKAIGFMSCVLCLYWDFLLTTDWILLLLWNQIHHPDPSAQRWVTLLLICGTGPLRPFNLQAWTGMV